MRGGGHRSKGIKTNFAGNFNKSGNWRLKKIFVRAGSGLDETLGSFPSLSLARQASHWHPATQVPLDSHTPTGTAREQSSLPVLSRRRRNLAPIWSVG